MEEEFDAEQESGSLTGREPECYECPCQTREPEEGSISLGCSEDVCIYDQDR